MGVRWAWKASHVSGAAMGHGASESACRGSREQVRFLDPQLCHPCNGRETNPTSRTSVESGVWTALQGAV